MKFQVDAVDQIIKNALNVMEDSRVQIFEICKAAILERDTIDKELSQIIDQIGETIEQVDRLEKHNRLSRARLVEVSRDFKRFSEDDIRKAYEAATQLQVELRSFQEKESSLKTRRNELQQRIRNIEKSIARAESLGVQMNVVLDYLSGDLDEVQRIIQSAKNHQMLGLKIILAQEEERKRIAREMHDGPAQSLANLILRTEIAERMLAKQKIPEVKEELGDLKHQVRQELEEVRKIIYNLRPMTLDDLGLVPAMRKYIQDFEEKTNIHTSFELKGKEVRLPSAMEVAVYRLVQEAFTNVLKHAKATHISLELSLQTQMIKIVVQDNGIGFNMAELQQRLTKNSHFGIVGMRERVELLDGRFEIESGLEVGTLISMTIPLNTELEECSI